MLELLKENELDYIYKKTYKKDSYIFRENELCESISYIDKGEVIISSFLNGKEIIYNHLFENELFGNNLIFSSFPYYKGNVISYSETTISFIRKEDLFKILKNNDEFLLYFLNYQSDFTKHLNDKIKLLSFDDAYSRLIWYFHLNDNEIKYISVTKLAKDLSAQRETLSRLISKLKKEKIIEVKDKTIRLIRS